MTVLPYSLVLLKQVSLADKVFGKGKNLLPYSLVLLKQTRILFEWPKTCFMHTSILSSSTQTKNGDKSEQHSFDNTSILSSSSQTQTFWGMDQSLQNWSWYTSILSSSSQTNLRGVGWLLERIFRPLPYSLVLLKLEILKRVFASGYIKLPYSLVLLKRRDKKKIWAKACYHNTSILSSSSQTVIDGLFVTFLISIIGLPYSLVLLKHGKKLWKWFWDYLRLPYSLVLLKLENR